MTQSKVYEFNAIIQQTEKYPNAGFVEVSMDVKKEFGKGRVKIIAEFDGEPYQGSLVKMMGVYMLILTLEIRKRIGKTHGDTVNVRFWEDHSIRTVDIPDYVSDVLKEDDLLEKFRSKSYTFQKEHIRGIEEAKRDETKVKRIQKLLDLLNS